MTPHMSPKLSFLYNFLYSSTNYFTAMMTILELCVPITNCDGDDPQTAHHHHQMKKKNITKAIPKFSFFLLTYVCIIGITQWQQWWQGQGQVEKDEEQEWQRGMILYLFLLFYCFSFSSSFLFIL